MLNSSQTALVKAVVVSLSTATGNSLANNSGFGLGGRHIRNAKRVDHRYCLIVAVRNAKRTDTVTVVARQSA